MADYALSDVFRDLRAAEHRLRELDEEIAEAKKVHGWRLRELQDSRNQLLRRIEKLRNA